MSQQPLGLYVHWPFCVSKCPYCDFNSHVRNAVDHKRWKDALLTELKHVGELTKGRPLKSVFFGGGTPSLMDPETVKAIIDHLGDYWQVDNPEISLEANPNSVEIEKFKDFRAAGVNRVSIGIQSLNADSLKFLGRAHNVDEATKAIEIAAKTFDRYSFDLIYALPGQTLEEWEKQLRAAMPLVRDHISLYQLTIEPGTAFHTAYARKDFTLPKGSLAAALFEKTDEILSEKGINRNEDTNHAMPGKECQHNLVYWRYQDYAGIGPGAHGRLTINGNKFATKTYRAPETWLDNVEAHGHAIQEQTPLSQNEQIIETLMMGLRLKEGINIESFKSNFNQGINQILDETRIQALINEGYLNIDAKAIKTTHEGMLRLNSLVGYLIDKITV
jgi:putative oxygen-independent coproporphyrinogen III oxidase